MSWLSTGLSKLAKEASAVEVQQTVLKSLSFREMEVRSDSITEAHPRTFEWVFDDSFVTDSCRTSFTKWLNSENNFWWVTGRPGSGKSTLMKFLVHNARTDTELQMWAGEKKLIVASFFFWSGGTALQKSQEGLLRSLLFEVLRQCPDKIQDICPRIWKTARDTPKLLHWNRLDLREAFEKLSSQGNEHVSFCFFIDGLDEYEAGREGNH